jgi:lysyl-tRNA synthetase class II
MNVVNLLQDPNKFIGKEVTLTGTLSRPRKKHSSYLFFNIETEDAGVQVAVKKDFLGEEVFKKLIYGLSHKDLVTVTGMFNLRNSDRADFYPYEVTATNIIKET